MSSAGNNRLSPERVEELHRLWVAGVSIRVAAKTGIAARRTVQNYYKVFAKGEELGRCSCGKLKHHVGSCRERMLELGATRPPCGCGKPASHQGWCSYRFIRSTKRQLALAQINPTYRIRNAGMLYPRRQAKVVADDRPVRLPTREQLMGSRAPGSSFSHSGGH